MCYYIITRNTKTKSHTTGGRSMKSNVSIKEVLNEIMAETTNQLKFAKTESEREIIIQAETNKINMFLESVLYKK